MTTAYPREERKMDTPPKHTPGPWEVHLGQLVRVHTHRGSINICNMHRRMRDINVRAEVEANARVIAAAPDMLAVLQLLVSNIEEYERVNNLSPSPGRQHCWDSVAHAHAIIAKATGATP